MACYVERLIGEIKATPPLGDRPLQTVFFGGGTPSLLAVAQVEAILQALDHRFGIAPTAEISMEMDPATFEDRHLQGYLAAGVNRISLGAQAFDDAILAACGRFHRRRDIFQAVELLHQAQVSNFSLDLISGLPYLSLETWQASLAEAIALGPTHLSLYDLTLEPQTPFGRSLRPGEAPLPSEAQTADMYRSARATLVASGYEHYEISNYAKPGFRARHNLTYWHSLPFYGFGMGATSYLNHQRIDRPRTQAAYAQWLSQYIAQGGVSGDPVTPASEQVLEQLMMGLRLAEGWPVAPVYALYGQAGLNRLAGAIAPYCQKNWVLVDHSSAQTHVDADFEIPPLLTSKATSHVAEPSLSPPLSPPLSTPFLPPPELRQSSRIRLSDPEGFLMSNQVIVAIFNALEKTR